MPVAVTCDDEREPPTHPDQVSRRLGHRRRWRKSLRRAGGWSTGYARLRGPGSVGSSAASSKSSRKSLSRTTITRAWEAPASASTCLSDAPDRVAKAPSRLASRRITESAISTAKPLCRYDRTSWNTFASRCSCLPTSPYVEYATRPCPSSIHARSCTPAELGELSLRTSNALASRTTGVHTRLAYRRRPRRRSVSSRKNRRNPGGVSIRFAWSSTRISCRIVDAPSSMRSK